MRSTLPQSTPVCVRAGIGVNGNDLRKYSRCSMEMKFVANAEALTPRCSGAAFSTLIIWRFTSPWIPVVACPRMLWSVAGMTRDLVSALDTKPDCVVAVLLSMNPLKRPLAKFSPLKKGGSEPSSQEARLVCLSEHAMPEAAWTLALRQTYYLVFNASSRSSRLRILPLALRGSGSSRNVKKSGTL